jgi:pimeloyl-ACP methyl ester carboxylesterase
VTQRPEAHRAERRPPAPSWFKASLADAPERSVVAVDGADIEVLSWGERGQPGLLLMHGFTAHADWWSFIAPQIKQGRRVIAFSFSGMGRSSWRDGYSMDQYAREAVAVAEAGGLFDAGRPPVLIGHSFGSFVARTVAHSLSERLGGIVLVDGVLAADENDDEYDGVPRRGHQHRLYPTLEQALARFRFAPPQACDNPFIVEFIARTSLGLAADAAGVEGWSWRFDPDLRAKMDAMPARALLSPVGCRMALMFGDRSLLLTRERAQLLRRVTPAEAPWIDIPDSGHHIMVDQPLALVAALRTVLESWQPVRAMTPGANLP